MSTTVLYGHIYSWLEMGYTDERVREAAQVLARRWTSGLQRVLDDCCSLAIIVRPVLPLLTTRRGMSPICPWMRPLASLVPVAVKVSNAFTH